MSNYTKGPGYHYIETEVDRVTYHPKQAGDEFWNDYSGRWERVITGPNFHHYNVYRRKVDFAVPPFAPPPAQWIALSDRMPTDGDMPVWGFTVKRGVCYYPGPTRPGKGCTHWCKAPMPPAGPSQAQLDRMAYDQFALSSNSQPYPFLVWTEALEYARNGKYVA